MRVVVIGGSSGIGKEIARQVAARAADVTITGRDAGRLTAAGDELGGVRTALLDAHDGAALDAFFAGLGPVDHLVSMVGDSMSGGFLTTTPETMRHVLHSKFWTNWLIGRHAARTLRTGGSLTFTSGTGGRAHDISGTYVANLGIQALVQGLAYEMAPERRVNAVAPTFMGSRTAFWREVPPADLTGLETDFAKRVPLRRVADVNEVAAAYLHLITNPFITGHVLPVDGGVMLDK
ncbi:MAG TPA: SDR family oxidoreductase [Streptosporangiaceae bacterium]|jgi:NAD(P)-dependent dehydrogenase (short-subunit alcohol dehydrogenase family)